MKMALLAGGVAALGLDGNMTVLTIARRRFAEKPWTESQKRIRLVGYSRSNRKFILQSAAFTLAQTRSQSWARDTPSAWIYASLLTLIAVDFFIQYCRTKKFAVRWPLTSYDEDC